MSRYGTVNPGNTSEIHVFDLDGREIVDGATVRLRQYPGERVTVVNNGADSDPVLWPLVEDLTVCPPYHTTERAYTFNGSQVIETITCVEWPVADVYALKERLVAQQDGLVRYNAVDSSLNANWWLVCTQSARFEILGVNDGWLQRQIDGQDWPPGDNAPWVLIYNQNTGALRREQVTGPTAPQTWEILMIELTQHDQATGNATNASGAALDAAYGDGSQSNFAAVAAHDPEDPAWGYPPTVTLP